MASKGAVVNRSSASHRRELSVESFKCYKIYAPTRVCLFLVVLFMEVNLRAMESREQIDNEDGVAAAVDAFHRHLPPQLPIPPPPVIFLSVNMG
ncbi:unnamed protein product [Musa acuminata subsp. malaccensis]|uniref:(wild Malaysian banana) hypothetical protein n=1 Tax=Musa acuminata subsp. malaccensis TaxID=214687 RepID=A0A804KDJ1_MUSAM|nr:unnamed protein product [Musa acuminata subsp. malaccensis]